MRLTKRLGQLHDLSLHLLLPAWRPRPTRHQRRPAGLNELRLPPRIDCSETFSFRAASAIAISPPKIANTIRVFFSGRIIGGRPSPHLLLKRRSCPHNRPARKFEAEHAQRRITGGDKTL
jgi:hypothetical protein